MSKVHEAWDLAHGQISSPILSIAVMSRPPFWNKNEYFGGNYDQNDMCVLLYIIWIPLKSQYYLMGKATSFIAVLAQNTYVSMVVDWYYAI